MTQPKWNPMRQAFDRPPSLADFLLARIGEDETDAHATRGVGLVPDFPDGCWTERRVLAECEAKRSVIALHADGNADLIASMETWDPDHGLNSYCVRCTVEHDGEPWPCLTLRLLAEPYADHPDYREEWRP